LYFYGTKDVNKGTWVSYSAHFGKRLFPPYASNFKKDWKDTFVKVKGAPNCVVASTFVNGEPKFPLSWTYSPATIMGYYFDKMTLYEQGDTNDLDAYLRE
jgi:hypothetical protein